MQGGGGATLPLRSPPKNCSPKSLHFQYKDAFWGNFCVIYNWDRGWTWSWEIWIPHPDENVEFASPFSELFATWSSNRKRIMKKRNWFLFSKTPKTLCVPFLFQLWTDWALDRLKPWNKFKFWTTWAVLTNQCHLGDKLWQTSVFLTQIYRKTRG